MVQSFWVRVDLKVIAMKGYSKLPRAPEQESHHQIPFRVILRTLFFVGFLPFCKGYSEHILSPTDKADNPVIELRPKNIFDL